MSLFSRPRDSASLSVEGRLPGFAGATGWRNSPLLAPSDVRENVVLRERASTAPPVEDRLVLQWAVHRLTLVFGLASIAVWTYVFNEWWGLLFAIAAAVPVGLVVAILPSMFFTTLRRLPLVNDALLTRAFILGGLVLGVYALIAFDGATLAMVALSGAEIFGAAIRGR
jgi:hypothetical protein